VPRAADNLNTCSDCAAPVRVLKTSIIGYGKAAAIKRRRGCTRCEARFITYELAFDDGGHADVDGAADLVLIRRSALVAAAQGVLGLLGPVADVQATKLLEQLIAGLSSADR
jgi:hypothetical protein